MNSQYIKDFLKKNWWLLWITLGITTISIVMIYFKLNATIENLKKIIYKQERMVVMVTPTGNVIPAKKTYFTEYSKSFQQALAKELTRYLIIDGAKATFNFSKLPTPEELVYGYDDLKIFYEKYLDKNAKYDYADYIKQILAYIYRKNYPDYISVLGIKIQSFEIYNNKFSISFLVNISEIYTDINTKKPVKAIATLTISAKGKLDPEKADFDNPFGIVLDKITITVPSIKNENI